MFMAFLKWVDFSTLPALAYIRWDSSTSADGCGGVVGAGVRQIVGRDFNSNSMCFRLLWLFLGFAAVSWGVSIFGVFLSWPVASEALQGLGAQPIAYDQMLDYWLRMAAGAFALIDCWYLVLMCRPQKHYAAIPWFGALMLVEGGILLAHGLRLSLPPFPFYADTAACFIGGGGILCLARHARPTANASRTTGQ